MSFYNPYIKRRYFRTLLLFINLFVRITIICENPSKLSAIGGQRIYDSFYCSQRYIQFICDLIIFITTQKH